MKITNVADTSCKLQFNDYLLDYTDREVVDGASVMDCIHCKSTLGISLVPVQAKAYFIDRLTHKS